MSGTDDRPWHRTAGNDEMKAAVISASELDDGLVSRWAELQAGTPDLCSPFFSPGFTTLLDPHRPDLRVAIWTSEGVETGFLPFHLGRGGCAAPVGGQINDYQGIIAAPEDVPDRAGFLEVPSLAAYDFNHALGSQALFAQTAFWHATSPRADLRAGLAAWQADVTAKGSALKSLARKRRKIARELGPLTFRPHDPDEAAWERFLLWKARSLERQGARGFLSAPWLAAFVDDLRRTRTPDFGGYLSTLYAGDRLVAAHFGIRSRTAWHWWFPTYDADLPTYSPGLLLMLACIEHAAEEGLHEVDFGRGTQRYKQEFSNRERALCEGSIARAASLQSVARGSRCHVQRLANRTLPASAADILRRAGTKVLRAGLI